MKSEDVIKIPYALHRLFQPSFLPAFDNSAGVFLKFARSRCVWDEKIFLNEFIVKKAAESNFLTIVDQVFAVQLGISNKYKRFLR